MNDERIFGDQLSICCDAKIYDNTDICSKCKEHTTPAQLTDEELDFLYQSNLIEGVIGHLDEAVNAWWFMKDRNKMSLHAITSVHRRLMALLDPTMAGELRNEAVTVGGRMCPNPAAVPYLLHDLVRLAIPKTEAEIKAWHVAFEWIHPFRDGNGRTGRILMNYQRIKNTLPLLVIHGGEEQDDYYKWFENPEDNWYLRQLGRF